jgi:hypothetical protein
MEAQPMSPMRRRSVVLPSMLSVLFDIFGLFLIDARHRIAGHAVGMKKFV